MQEYNTLQEALIMVLDEDIRQAEAEAAGQPEHQFSPAFEYRMRKLIGETDGCSASSAKAVESGIYRSGATVRLFGRTMRRAAVIAAAAILILALTACAVMIVKPEIYYAIWDKVTHWEVTPTQEDGSDETGEMGIVPYHPELPEDYRLVEENLDEISYEATYRNSDGDMIFISQYHTAAGLTIDVDSEGSRIQETQVNGYDAVISEDDNEITIIIENGQYTFTVTGDDKDIVNSIADNIASAETAE